ncbi:hypothetical protein scyTo_0019700 [Scyliorhinus torazame]|uniref:Uncharacterized protein n=1 Tax=Scyliorhinus torazame TaxID=75743 RepID=A0A401PPJ7_SCYTO|nr:hypothetical protein [Scyliorhinus torazame]
MARRGGNKSCKPRRKKQRRRKKKCQHQHKDQSKPLNTMVQLCFRRYKSPTYRSDKETCISPQDPQTTREASLRSPGPARVYLLYYNPKRRHSKSKKKKKKKKIRSIFSNLRC